MDTAAPLFVLGSIVIAHCAKVSHLPNPGESLRASAFTIEPGGKGFNFAIGAHRLGVKVDGIFGVGKDHFSQLALSAFADAGLSQEMLVRLDAGTGTGIGFTDARGENCLAVYPGANVLLSATDVRSVAEAVRRAALVLAQFEIRDEPIVEAFVAARKAGRSTLLNPSPYRSLDPDILQHTSILILNRTEAAAVAADYGVSIGGTLDGLEPVAAALMQRGPGVIIISLGERGVVAYRRDAAPLHQPSFTVDVVDTIGAGDALTAGFAASLLDGRPFHESLMRAAACGAMVCRGAGVLKCLPTSLELDEFLTRYAP